MPRAAPGPTPRQGTQPTCSSHPETTPPHSTLNSRASWPTPRQGLDSRLLHGIWHGTDIGYTGRVNPRTHPTSLVWPTLPTSPSSNSLCLSPAHTHTGTPSHTHVHVHVHTCTHASTNGYSLSHTCTCTIHASTYDCLPMYLHVHAHKRHFLPEGYMYMYMHTHAFTPMGTLCPTHTCVHVHANTCIHTYQQAQKG